MVVSIIGSEEANPGEQVTIRFKFTKQPEFVKPMAKVYMREGSVKAIGRVTKVIF